jgi:Flp pilus assembly protein TadD/predicted Ser/Thr protein kinase
VPEIPRQVGPYNILGRLGEGGMGEVFLAYDKRLDRKVAVKRVRGGDLSVKRRQRLQREAQMAARLSHPAIVQVHDLVTDAEGDHIVMEYVDGPSLRKLLTAGPLSPGLVLPLACEIAAGLAEAHRMGVIHRDLKAENILVTPSGHAKIADFGLARRLDGEDRLTASNAVLGTYRTMSPEQARGEPADHRSDLFSFGVLLYEMLSGESPFHAENGLATLQRIASFQPPPLSTVVPGLPPELSNLVGHLMQKDPSLRPSSAGEVLQDLEEMARDVPREVPSWIADSTWISGIAKAGEQPAAAPSRRLRKPGIAMVAFLAVAVAAPGVYLARHRPPAAPAYVAVTRPEIVAPEIDAGQIEILASGVRTATLRGLMSLKGISPMGSKEVDDIAGPPTAVARAVSADEILTSRLDCRRELCQATLSRLRGADGSVIQVESFELPIDDVAVMSNILTGQIRRTFSEHEVREGSPDIEASSADVRTFLELRRRFDARSEPSTDSILAQLAEVRKSSPRFLDAYLLEAEVSYFRYHLNLERKDREHAVDLLRQAREIDRGDSQPLFILIDLALADNDLAKAEATLAELETLVPGDARVLDRKARILSAQGKTEEAIELLERSVRLRPDWKRLYSLAQMEYRHGKVPEARRDLGNLLEIAPGNVYGLSLLGEIELVNGDLHEAVRRYSELVRRSSTPNRLSNLGLAYLLLHDYGRAAEVFREVMEHAPRNPALLINLADACHLLGRTEEARRHYQRVIELAGSEGGPENLGSRAQALAHLGRGREAVTVIREAERLAPDDAGVAYAAAVVYATLGEKDSALVSIERARKLGYQPRWFTLAWFQGLEDQPEFQELIRQAPSER